MKKYVFLTPSICCMGGAEEYINKKVRYLQNHGYQSFVFSSRRGEVMIQNLMQFEKDIIHPLGLPPYIYAKHFINKILNRISLRINYRDDDDIYIESTAMSMNQWGELLAKKLKAEHVVIDLQEKHDYPLYFQDFLLFKYKREELYGIKDDSIKQIFSLIPDNYEPRSIKAACTDVVEDIDCDLISKIPDADYNICSIGRLDKTFVLYGCEEVVRFAKKYYDKKINLIFIGGGSNARIKEIQNVINGIQNINLIITGYMYPIPKKFLEIMNCFYSSAGSSWVSAKAGYPTVSMSADGDPLGILYYTTVNSLYKPNDYIKIDLCDYLEMILIEKYCEKNKPKFVIDSFDRNKEFERQLTFFGRYSKDYYNVLSGVVLTKKEKIYKFVSSIVGGFLFEKIQYAMHKLKGAKDV